MAEVTSWRQYSPAVAGVDIANSAVTNKAAAGAVIFKSRFMLFFLCVGFSSEIATWDVTDFGAINAEKKKNNSMRYSAKARNTLRLATFHLAVCERSE